MGEPWGFPTLIESPRVDSNHEPSGSEPDASAGLGYEGGDPRRGTRTPNLLFVREALSAIELPAVDGAARRPGPTRTGARGFEAHCSLPLSYGAERDGGSRARTCGRARRAYAVAGRCLTTRPCLRARVPACVLRGRAAHAVTGARACRERKRKERESNPQAC